MDQIKNNIISISLFILLTGIFIYSVFIPSTQKINTDFPNYYVSSNMYLDGKDMRAAYDNVEFNRQLLLYGIDNQIVSYTPYPPLTALIMLPVAKLTPLEAKLWWNIFNLLLLVCCIFILSKITQLDYFKCGLIFFLSGFALANNFMFGQVYLLVLFFLLMGMYFMQRDKDILSALFIALSIVLKFYTIFFIFLFIFKKKYKLLVYSLVFSVAIYIPVVLLTGFDLNWFYFTTIMPRLGDAWVGTVYAAEYQSWLSLVHRWFSYEPMLNPEPLVESALAFYILKYSYIFLILALAISVLKRSGENLKLELSLFCITCLLLLPVNASYQFVVLIPAVAILFKYFYDKKKYFAASSLVLLMFLMNSHVQIFITNSFKDSPFNIFAYVKLIGLLIFFTVNFKILLSLNEAKLFNKRTSRLLVLSGIPIVVLTILSYSQNKPINNIDKAEFIPTGNNYLVSMPSAFGNRLIWTECINDKFVLRSNFGFGYDKENVFYPVLIDSQHIAFETIENKQPKQKVIDVTTGIQRDASAIKLNEGSFNKDKTIRTYSAQGIIYIEDPSTGKKYPLTSGKQMCYYPVFTDGDSTVIFCSDRSRGVNFTALYKMKIR
ncbi:MAG TPA: glycosyltransferase family 87 protein [Ignavibacteria bacterium]|nr:glycosyltransferase family 87 protein [Ignavibacteria bacterium]HRF67553.1 glycosyltransferase family 87 protein [Ignavibacteria bacterium]